MPVSRGTMTGRAILARRAVQVEDYTTDPELVPAAYPFTRAGNIRTILAVPLLLNGDPIGGITLARTRVAPFDDKQVALVEAFADQAVIAIENTRLFEAEQASKRELQEALEYQIATSEVLGVISRSPSELQPVLDAITATARRLGEATRASIMEFKDGQFLQVSSDGPEVAGSLRRLAAKIPRGVDRGNLAGRAAIERRTVHVHDIRSDPEIHILCR